MGNRSQGSNPPIDSSALIEQADIDFQMVPTATLKPPVHIRKDSINFTQETNSISFIYDSYSNVTITSYFFAVEAVKAQGNTECYYIDLEKYPNPIVNSLPGGLNQQFPDGLCLIDTSKYQLGELTFLDNKVYPLIIEIVIII